MAKRKRHGTEHKFEVGLPKKQLLEEGLCVFRGTTCYQLAMESALNLQLMCLNDAQYVGTPFYGCPKTMAHLRWLGQCVNPKRVRRLICKMG